MRVAVIGTGHVGLITCVTLASIGHDVVGTDADLGKVGMLRTGISPFYEPGAEELLRRELRSGRLCFTAEPAEAFAGREVVFICVGTPPRADGEAKLSAVEAAARQFARHATGPAVVVEKSTVPAGTAEWLRRTLAVERPDLAGLLEVVSNPEFLREGTAVEDSLRPDRILVGAGSAEAFDAMRRLYAPLVEAGARLIETDIATAELAKHACNAFLSLKISFANALARVCELAGADVVTVADVMGHDPRIGRAFLDAGLGFGGYCFPKDLQAFERLAHRLGYEFPLLAEAARINDEAVQAAVAKVRDGLWNLEGKRVALLGLAFKAGTDDVRLSPALAVARRLASDGAEVVGFDPRAGANARAEMPGLEVAPDPYRAAAGAHALVVCTDWPEFRALDLPRLRSRMAYPLVVDGRNLFDPAEMVAAGFVYHPTGRPKAEPDLLAPSGPERPRARVRVGAVTRR
jgi:UDPglucose 6-dehydrogenase